jgi:hypothetical protein
MAEPDYPFNAEEDRWIELSVTSAAADVVATVGHLLARELHHTYNDALATALVTMPAADDFMAALLSDARGGGKLTEPEVSSAPDLQFCHHRLGVQDHPDDMYSTTLLTSMLVLDVFDRYLASQRPAFAPWRGGNGTPRRALYKLLKRGLAATLFVAGQAAQRDAAKVGRGWARPIWRAVGQVTAMDRAVLEHTLVLPDLREHEEPVRSELAGLDMAAGLNGALDRLWSALCAPIWIDKTAC